VPLAGVTGVGALALLILGAVLVAVFVGVVESVMARLRLSRVPQLLVGSGALALFAAILLLR
jgi:formate hydrogenlyase subunit 4